MPPPSSPSRRPESGEREREPFSHASSTPHNKWRALTAPHALAKKRERKASSRLCV